MKTFKEQEGCDFVGDHLELVEMSKRKFWYGWLKLCLLIQDVDLYALFKSDRSLNLSPSKKRVSIAIEASLEHLQTNDLNQPDELGMSHTNWDRVRVRLARLLRVFTAYSYAKMLLVCFLQYNLLRHQYQTSENQNHPPLRLETAQWLAELIGNPLYPLKDTSFLFYLAGPGYLFMTLILFSIHYQRYPMDNAPLRFLLDPLRELKRVDACIRSKLTKMIVSLDTYRQQQQQLQSLRLQRQLSEMFANFLPIQDGNQLASRSRLIGREDRMKRDEEYFCHQIQRRLSKLHLQPARWNSFRPRTFSAAYFVKIYPRIQPVVFATILLGSVCNCGIGLTFWIVPYADKCPHLDCNPSKVYSFSEVLMGFETIISSILIVTAASMNIIQITLISANQLTLIESIKRELVACQTLIKTSNQYGKLHEHVSMMTRSNKTKLGQQEPRRNKQAFLNRLELDGCLLDSLIRLFVCDDELARNSRCISMEVLDPFYYALLVIFIIITSGQFKLPDPYFVRNMILIVCWLIVNTVGISCAYLQARVREFKRVLWSILAASHEAHRGCYHEEYHYRLQNPSSNLHLAHYRDRSKQMKELPAGRGFKCCAFVVDMWTKFALSSVNNSDRHCPRLFFVEFSYQRLIEANFFAIFVYTYTLRD